MSYVLFAIMIGAFVFLVVTIVTSIPKLRRMDEEQDHDLRMMAALQGWEETEPDEIMERIDWELQK